MKKHLLMFFVAVMAATMSLRAQIIVIDEGFENGIQDSVWTQEFVVGHNEWAVESNDSVLAWPSTVKQGSKRAYLRNTTGETQGYVTRLVSKVMDLSPRKVYQPELSFWYANPKWTNDRDTLRVLYRNNVNGKWKQLAEFSNAMSNWQKVTLELPEVGSTYQIAFEGSDNLGRGIVLDSVKLRSAPECTVPHDIMVSNKGSNRVNIAWSASWDAIYFELIVSRDTINLDAVEELSEDVIAYHGLVNGLQQNYDLTLESGETYYVYIRSLCENETSLWSSEESENGPYKFRVRATKQVPFMENFNYTTTQKQDPEWTWKNNIDKSPKTPYVNSSNMSNYSPDGTKHVVFAGAASPTSVIKPVNYVYLATPALADTTNNDFHLNQCQVRFWSTVYTSTGRTYARSLIVGVMDDPDDITTFVPIDTVSVWGNKTFQESIVDLASYTGSGAFIGFVSDFDRQNLFYIDNVTIEYRPEIQKVTKISVNPRDTYATISWEGNAPSYNVLITNAEVDPSNPSADAVVDQATVTANSYLCNQLEAFHSWNRPYYVYVQAEGTEWSYRYPFVTLARERALPYTFDFEPASGRYKIGSGSTYYVDSLGIFSNDPKYPSMGSANVYKGSGCLFMNKIAGADAWVTLPLVEDLDSVQVKFFLSGNTTYAQSHASIGIMTNPMDINTFTKVASFTLNTTGYTMCYANFKDYAGPDGVIAIVWDDIQGMAKNTINYIDELKVEKVSECTPPQNIELEIESDSVTVSWSATSQSMWEVAVSRSALTTSQRDKTFAEIAALGQVIYADTLLWFDETRAPEFGIGGLHDQTDYVMYIRTVCGGDAAWWTEIPFHTPCPNYSLPFKETFESCTTSPNLAAPQLGCWQMADYLGTGYPMIYTAGSKTLELYSIGTTHRNVVILPAVEGNLSDMMLCFETRSWSSSSNSVVYVGSMGDINDANSFVPFDTIYNTANAGFQKVCLVLNDYTLAHENIAISSGLGTLMMNSDVVIDNVELRDATCIEAYDIKQTATTQDAVDFEWKGLSKNDQWELRVLNTNVSLENVASGNYDTLRVAVVNDTIITGKTFHVDNLAPVSTYYVYLRAFCGDSLWATGTIQTACERLDPNKPNKETFENYQGGTSYNANYQAQCWTTGNYNPNASTSYLPYIYNSSTYSNSGTKSYHLYGYSTTSSPAYVVSPEIDCVSMSDLAVTFYMYASSSYSWVCGVMSDPNDLSTFVVIDSVKGVGSSVLYTYDLSEYSDSIPATAKYFAWRTPYLSSSSYSSLYLDDISILKMNCPFTKPSYSDLTAQSVRISSGLRTDDEWILLVTNQELNTDSLLSPTYKIPASVKVSLDTVDVRSQRVNGLSEQTKYYVYTASYCDSTVSQWSSLSFVTPCLPLKPDAMGTITFSTAEGYVTGTGASRYLPCWTVGSKTQGISATSSYYPSVGTTSSYQHNGHNYLYMYDYVYSTTSNYVGSYAIMPELYVDTISKYQVNFWARGSSSTSYNAQVIVGIVSDPSDLNTFVAVDTINLSHTGYEPFSVGFENYEGDFLGNMGKNIMFLSDFGMTNYAYISEISVERIPSCRAISSFKVDSIGENAALVSWKGYQNSYRLLVSDALLEDADKPDYPYLIDSIVDHSDRILIDNLNPATNYYVYAQGICGEGDSTSISMLYANVRTLCPISTGVPLPFYDDFMSYEVDEVDPGCWITRGSSWTKVKSVTVGTKTYHAIDLYTTSSGNNGYIVVPVVQGNLEDLKVTFFLRTYSTSQTTPQHVYLGTMEDPEDPTTFVAFDSIALTGSEDFAQYERILGEYNLVHNRLAFTSGFGTTSSDVYITNIGLSLESPCHAPKLKAAGVAASEIDLQIIPSKEENDQWDVVVISDSLLAKIRNLDRYLDTTSTRMRVDTTFITLTGLQSATTYNIYARTACGGVYGNSAWSREPLRVHTQFYFKDGYHFGFEKTELWERSIYSNSDNYYLHPALVAGRDSLGAVSTSYSNYPYSMENGTSYIYSHTGSGALIINASGSYFGGYVIFPAVDDQQTRSFEFKIRPGYLSATTQQISGSSDGVIEIGTVARNKGFETYRHLATVRMEAWKNASVADSANNYLFHNFTLDLDEATVASRQIVLHAPQQPSINSVMYLDEVVMGEAKGFSLVSLKTVTVSGTSATVEWDNIGGPWNLYLLNQAGDTLAQYNNLTATSQFIDNLTPRTQYKAVLEAAEALNKAEGYVVSTSMTFETTCQIVEPDAQGVFSWDFDDPYEWESNDVLAGTAADTAYMKPGCFHVGITYDNPVNGYQWLVQRKGFDYYSTLMAYSADRHFEVGRTDSHSLRVHTSATNFNSYLVLPQLHCGLDTMMIEFYGRCFVNYDETYTTESSRGKIVNASYLGAEYSQSMVVGTLTDPNDFSTLQVIDTLTYKHTNLSNNDNVNDDPAGMRYWELMQLPLTGAQGQYIVLFQPAYGLFFLDDLSVKPIGSTLFAPSNMQTSDITAVSATMSWSVRHPELQSVVVVLNSTGTEEVLRDTLSGTSYTAMNLNPGNSYQWYVYQTDGTNNTPFSVRQKFATECVTITPDYTCGFEIADGWGAIPGQVAYNQALCWTYSDAYSNSWDHASYDPYNQPNSDIYLYSRTDSFAVMMRASYGSYQPYIAMPAMDVAAYDTLQVEFWMRPGYVRASTGKIASTYTGSSYSKSIIVGTMTDPTDASTFMPLDTVTYDGALTVADVASEVNDNLYQQMKVELVGATGPYIAFMTSFYAKGSSTRVSSDYIWLDDISFSRRQMCKDPKNLNNDRIGAVDATLSWEGGDSVFVLQVSTDQYFAEDTAFVFNDTIIGNPYTVTGLNALTTYYWRVQAICSDVMEQSGFSPKASFKTLRSPYFLEEFTVAVSSSEWTFSNSHADNIVDQNAATSTSDNTYGFKRAANNFGLQGPHYTAVGYYADYNWMITPEFYLPENDSVHFSMDLAMTACNTSNAATANPASESDMKDDYYFMIIVSDDGGATWKSENILMKWQNTNPGGQQLRDIPSDGMNVRFSLAQYAGKNVRIGLYREAKTSCTTGIAIHVDNVRLAYFDKVIEHASGCQYEDITIGDIFLSGDDTKPGIHIYPQSNYASDEDAKAGARDLVYSLEVEVYPVEEVIYTDTICDGDTYSDVNFHGKDQTGIYRRKMESSHGCDSIITLNLYVIPTLYGEDAEVSICQGETFMWNGKPYNRAGIFRDTLVSSLGCDSVETLVISYFNIEDTVYASQTVYTDQLPFTYVNDQYPYAVGQAPVFFAEGTPKGVYNDTIQVQGEQCNTVLVLTTTIDWHQSLDQLNEDADGARKVIYRDQMYIILNDEWYNASGRKVADPR